MRIALCAIAAAGAIAAPLLVVGGKTSFAEGGGEPAPAGPCGIQVSETTAPPFVIAQAVAPVIPPAAPPIVAAPPPVAAAPPPPPPPTGVVLLPPPPPPSPPILPSFAFIDELKAGGLVHDANLGDHHVETGTDINLEVLFKSPALLSLIGSPRPHIGGDINTSGNTSSGYAGLTWRLDLIGNLINPADSIFVTGSLGGAIHDGFIDTAPAGRKRLGSRVLFRESAEIGYQITPTYSLAAFVDHISNANLGRHNAGDTNVGGRVGVKF